MADAVKEIIESKIENIENKELKRVLLQIMPELAKRQENIRAELLERLNGEIASQGKIELSIGTVLVDNEESELIKREGCGIYTYDIGGCLFKKNKLLSEPNNNLCKEFFLNLPYRSIQEIIDKKEKRKGLTQMSVSALYGILQVRFNRHAPTTFPCHGVWSRVLSRPC